MDKKGRAISDPASLISNHSPLSNSCYCALLTRCQRLSCFVNYYYLRRTTVVFCAVLFEVSGSVVTHETLAVFVMVPALFGATTSIVTAEIAPLFTWPKLQVTVPESSLHVPCVDFTDTNLVPDGRVSVKTTPAALFGPLLVMTTT